MFKSLEMQTCEMDCQGFCRAHSLIHLSPADVSCQCFVIDSWEAAITEWTLLEVWSFTIPLHLHGHTGEMCSE